MNVYSIDFAIYATAYIKASSPEEALAIAKRDLAGSCVNETEKESEVEFSSVQFDDPDLPQVSLSPVMTICQPAEFDEALIECVEENVK